MTINRNLSGRNMTHRFRTLRRKQLDVQLAKVRRLDVPTPREGWISSIREALGMSMESFAKRLGIARQSAHHLEKSEVKGSITINRLRSAANALDCDLVVMVVPRKPLEAIVRDNSLRAAWRLSRDIAHTMALEQQELDAQQVDRIVQETAVDLVNRGDQRIWA